MKKIFAARENGFTLIELMVAVAILGITLSMFGPLYYNTLKISESRVALQIAHRALRNEVEILRSLPPGKLVAGESLPFDPRVEELESLPGGRGVVEIKNSQDSSGLLKARVEVHWRDPVSGMRSIHTVIYRRDRKGYSNGQP